MINLVFYIIVGALFAYYQPFAAMYVEGTNRYGEPAMLFNNAFYGWTAASFVFGMFVASVVRFVGPKRVHVITLLGTKPIQQLETGLRITLPWPFGYTHKVVSTDVQDLPIMAQVKPKDNLVYDLPVNAQWYVTDALKFAIERNNPKGQLENLLTAAIRGAASKLTLFEVYDDKDEVQKHADEAVKVELASFGVAIKELVVQDPHLPDSTAKRLSAIREAEFDKEAAAHEAEAVFIRMVGQARAEAESTRLKGSALSNFRLLIAEGNAASVAVMQGKLGLTWVEEKVGEGDEQTTVKKPKFVKPEDVEGGVAIPEIDIAPELVLEFFKVVDGNDAIRDAAAKPGTTVVLATGATAEAGLPAALMDQITHLRSAPNTAPVQEAA